MTKILLLMKQQRALLLTILIRIHLLGGVQYHLLVTLYHAHGLFSPSLLGQPLFLRVFSHAHGVLPQFLKLGIFYLHLLVKQVMILSDDFPSQAILFVPRTPDYLLHALAMISLICQTMTPP